MKEFFFLQEREHICKSSCNPKSEPYLCPLPCFKLGVPLAVSIAGPSWSWLNGSAVEFIRVQVDTADVVVFAFALSVGVRGSICSASSRTFSDSSAELLFCGSSGSWCHFIGFDNKHEQCTVMSLSSGLRKTDLRSLFPYSLFFLWG